MSLPTCNVSLVDEMDAPVKATAVAMQPAGSDLVLMFERLAKDPSVPVEKLEKLMDLQERFVKFQAKADFDAAFSQMQGAIPVIGEKGEIIVEGKVRSKYARNEDIQVILKPILQEFGFSLRFRNEFAADGALKIIGILSHRSGHSEQDEFVCKADTSGSKNAIQALGSSRSYGQRYTTIALLNIATSGEDDDGKTSEKFKAPEAPAGYDDWMHDMAACADEGIARLSKAWNDSRKEYREHTAKVNKDTWESLKERAKKVGAA